MRALDKAVRRELDRLAGEIVRRQDECDACLELYRRREALRALVCPGGCRALKLMKWRLKK